MTVRYGKFELPSKIKKDEATKRPNHARFIAEPFEKGFGHTVGNALRRILYTAIESPALLSFRIEGTSNEYASIEGVVEDVTQIVLNCKSARLRKLPMGEQHASRHSRLFSKQLEISSALLEKHKGQYTVTLKDVLGDTDFEVVNPELPLFSVTKPLSRKIDIRVGFGRGYLPAERNIIIDKADEEIVLDAIFSPVELVNYYVESTRVGQDTDFDRLILDVTTDGRISPDEALGAAMQVAMLHFGVFEDIKKHHILKFDAGMEESSTDRDELLAKLALKITEIELTVRSLNCLVGANIETIGEVVVMSQQEMLKFRNFGKKSLNEIEEKLKSMGLHFGMDLSRYGITRDNIKQMTDDYLARKGAAVES